MIRLNPVNKIAFISSFPPRMCGIATYVSHLIENMKLASNGSFEPVIISVESDNNRKFSETADYVIRKDCLSDYMEAADLINSANVDMVFVQHEFGLFGGQAGSYINMLLKRLEMPVITTLHTVLKKPTAYQYQAMIDVCDYSTNLVLMNRSGLPMLEKIYGVSSNKVTLIPHGIPEVPFNESNKYKRKLGLNRRKIMLTFGLLSPGKGIEVALQAMPRIIKKNRRVLYLIVGRTHPEIIKHSGYAYRDKLQKMVKDMGIENNVRFLDEFVSDERLIEYLAAADVYVNSSLNEEQLTSGTLSFAVGSGNAAISTPFWAACELLEEGRGTLVPFGDSDRLAEAAVEYLNDEVHLKITQNRAYNFGRTMTWDNVGRQYWRIANSYLSEKALNSNFEYSYYR